jgi:hypothetical protein
MDTAHRYYSEYERLGLTPYGKRGSDPHYSAYKERGRDPESAFRGVLAGAVLGALLWVPILWLIL